MFLRESILIIKNKYSLKVLQILTKFLLKFKEIVIQRISTNDNINVRYRETQV